MIVCGSRGRGIIGGMIPGLVFNAAISINPAGGVPYALVLVASAILRSCAGARIIVPRVLSNLCNRRDVYKQAGAGQFILEGVGEGALLVADRSRYQAYHGDRGYDSGGQLSPAVL